MDKLVKSIIEACDQNKNNKIDYREFIAATVRKQLFNTENSRE